MSELKFILLIGVLTQNFNIVDLVKFLEKKSKNSHSNLRGYIEDGIMHNHEQKTKVKKCENPRFHGQNKLLS
jgi:hypothetical protein